MVKKMYYVTFEISREAVDVFSIGVFGCISRRLPVLWLIIFQVVESSGFLSGY
jgi:hypothetical protein